jgi:hypothetical protein
MQSIVVALCFSAAAARVARGERKLQEEGASAPTFLVCRDIFRSLSEKQQRQRIKIYKKTRTPGPLRKQQQQQQQQQQQLEGAATITTNILK